jgi:lysophospholipase L1-like esterase
LQEVARLSSSGSPPARSALSRALFVVAVNVGLLVVLLLLVEAGYRIYRDGFPGAFTKLVEGVPYANLGTSHWLVSDERLGYRLNPLPPEINERSVRHPEIEVPKPAGTCRLIFLGDSIVWAAPYVDPSAGFVELTRQRLAAPAFEVINAGIPGYTAYQELEFFKEWLLDTDPDLVIWVYCLNDNHKFLHRVNEDAKLLWTEEAEKSLEINNSWDKLVSHSYVLTQLKLGVLATVKKATKPKRKFVWKERHDMNIAWKDYSWPRYEEYVEEMKGILDERGIGLCIVVVPFEPQIVTHRYTPDEYDYVFSPQRHVAEICGRLDIPCLDLTQPLSEYQYAHQQGLFVADNVHLNEIGHTVAADEIREFLRGNGLLDRACGTLAE